VNEALLEQLNHTIQKVANASSASMPSSLDILKWPGIIQEQEQESKVIEEASLSLFRNTVQLLKEHRDREGAELEKTIEGRLAAITNIVNDIREALPDILERQKQRLQEQVAELTSDLDPERLEQELVLIMQKADIFEEIDRLDAHVKEIRHVLSHNEPIGRRLDFLMQELNREANTICSKSVVTETTLNAVELKVLIEQMREQIQNIE
jgi:uncharacterized protein (TIGR00255 family)